jgi:hypothetical protein
MTEFERLPQRVKSVISRVREGERLCASYRTKDTAEHETKFFFEPSGKSCGPASASAAIASGFLKSRGDALFEDALSQTYEAA